MLLQELGLPAVLINEAGDIIYIHGKTGRYLEPAVGKAAMNIFVMAREGLGYGLSHALKQVRKHKAAHTLKGLKVKINGGHQYVDVTIKPVSAPAAVRGYLLVIFRDVDEPFQKGRSVKISAGSPAERSARIARLQKELSYTREQLQKTMEQMQTSEEELKSINEELQSGNEELQSANEELTTSREEMQSLNEELMSVNNELQTKMDELTLVNNDMKNLLNSTEIATLFLDNNLHIRRFTSQTTRVMRLLPGDAGRPFADISIHLLYDNLESDARDVLETLICKEKQVMARDGSWFLMRIIPYRTATNVIDGVVITFIDITAAIKLENTKRESEERLKAIIETIPLAITIIDSTGRITFANTAAEQIFGLLRSSITTLAHDASAWKITTAEGKSFPADELPFKRVMSTGKSVYNVEYAIDHPDGKRITLSINAAPLRDAGGAITGVVSSIVDITGRVVSG
jgi:two-component system, chemotaxis family, CheB/CheR fusion protein